MSRLGGQHGFTLIEVLVAIVILSTGIVVVLRAFETSVVALGEARDRMWATLLVSQKLAEAQAYIHDNPGSLPTSGSGQFQGSYRAFHWQTTVGAPPFSVAGSLGGCAGAPLSHISVAVWRQGTKQKFTGETFLRAKNDANES